MSQPTITLIPMHQAIAIGRSVTLDVLVKITPPAVEPSGDRPPLNLGFVLDRSGSMSGSKIDYARQAIAYAVEQLLPSDRLSLTLFDTHVETKIPSTLATEKQRILDIVRRVQVGNSTALHAGWVNGGIQVSAYLHPEHLNRVILLSDGQANVGETNPDAISTDVHRLMQTGVTTSTLGVGADYDENLLEAMARSGDGNFFHIASPEQLPDIFETELQGLVGTLYKSVTLAVEPTQGTVLQQVLNDLEKDDQGALKLPNITIGSPINIVVRLQIPALQESTSILTVKLTCQAPDAPETSQFESTLHLNVVTEQQMSDFPANPEVQEQVALLMAARARQEAINYADRGDYAGSAKVLEDLSAELSAMPASAPIADELSSLEDLSKNFTDDPMMARKRAMSERYHMNRSRSSDYGKKKRPE
jgi:Ca-activated chloride channel family protein